MKLRADFHVHTHYSYDSSLDPEELVRRAREEKIDVLGVADHGTCQGAIATRKIARGNPLVLIGQEVNTARGEILVFGPETDLTESEPPEITCKKAKDAVKRQRIPAVS
jgi:predicted metal-dependent phosphoesterase TrpH